MIEVHMVISGSWFYVFLEREPDPCNSAIEDTPAPILGHIICWRIVFVYLESAFFVGHVFNKPLIKLTLRYLDFTEFFFFYR